MERQLPVSSFSGHFLITPESVVPIARRLVTLDRSAFTRNTFTRKTRILQALRSALYDYRSNCVFRRLDHRWILQVEQEPRQLITMTREAMTLLKLFARSKLMSLLSTEDEYV